MTKGNAPAGNYRIEITATPGVGQVQKSNVMAIEYDHVTTPVAPTTPGITPSDTIDISDGTD
ncbi:MAG: hypothetical protein LBR38_03820, partial [Synergistaceae bacterium]|nr:hypothetical protein [Synergistaceae bacterium]